MIDYALNIAFAAIAVAFLLTAWRLWLGPSLPDRIMALDKLYINAAVLLVLLGIKLDNSVFFEVAILIALLGFISTVALCKHITRGDIIE